MGLTREKGEQDLDATIRTRMKVAGAEGSTEARKHGSTEARTGDMGEVLQSSVPVYICACI